LIRVARTGWASVVFDPVRRMQSAISRSSVVIDAAP
jgi:hypothetical protein